MSFSVKITVEVFQDTNPEPVLTSSSHVAAIPSAANPGYVLFPVGGIPQWIRGLLAVKFACFAQLDHKGVYVPAESLGGK